MKIKITQEWLLKNAERDQDLEVAVGFLSDHKLNAVYESQKQQQQQNEQARQESQVFEEHVKFLTGEQGQQ
jgi:hypothetical protein